MPLPFSRTFTVAPTVSGRQKHALAFFRGLEPREAFTLKTADYDVTVTVDARNRIKESNEANNKGETGPDPHLRCIVVPG